MRKYGLLLLSLFFIVKCQVIPLIKIAKTTGAVKTEIIATQEVAKTLEGTAEVTKKTVEVVKDVVKKVKKLQKPIVLANTLTHREDETVGKEMTEEELFAKMFGSATKTQDIKDLIVPLIINKKYGSKTKLNILGGVKYIESNDLALILEQIIDPNVMQQIFDPKNIVNGGISLATLKDYGIKGTFDEDELTVNIDVGAKMMRSNEVKLSSFNVMTDQKLQKMLASESAAVSGASNFYLNNDMSNDSVSGELKQDTLRLTNKTFVNVNDYIFETGAMVTDTQIPGSTVEPFVRDYTRINKDFPKNDLRLQVGDVALAVRGNMVSANILGASFVKNHEITRRTHQSIRLNSKELFLENESRLQVYVNDRLVRTLELAPGTHKLTDFPMVTGLNNVTVKITDIFGNEKVIDFDEYLFQEILRKGESTFAISAGVYSEKAQDATIDYFEEKPLLSGYYNIGLMDSLTLNSGFQLNNRLYNLSADLNFGTTKGLFTLFGITSQGETVAQGSRYGARYKQYFDNNSLTMQMDYADNTYQTILSDAEDNLGSKNFLLSYVTPLFKNGSILFGYENTSNELQNINKYSSAYSYTFSREWNMRLGYDLSNVNDILETNMRFLLQYKPSNSRFNYRTNLDYTQRQDQELLAKRVEVDYNKIGKHGFNGGYSYTDYDTLGSNERFRGMYTTNFYTASADYYTATSANSAQTQALNLNLATAVAFVNSDVAVSNPVSNSFVLVKNDPRLTEPLGIKSHNDKDPSWRFVMPVSDYQEVKVTIEDKNLMFGAELEKNEYMVSSKYKTGTLIEIIPKFILSVKGKLRNKDDVLLTRKVFKLYKIEKDGRKVAIEKDDVFFTNKYGKFIIGSIDEGRYKAEEINSETNYEFEFDLSMSKGETGIINLGTIIVKNKREQLLSLN